MMCAMVFASQKQKVPRVYTPVRIRYTLIVVFVSLSCSAAENPGGS